MRLRIFFVLLLVFVLPLLAVTARADNPVLQSAGNFAVLGASGVTNTGATTINGGNVGSFPNISATSITGATICPGAVDCITITAGNTIGPALPLNQVDLIAAISGLSALSSLNIGTAGLSGNVTVTPGVYSSPSDFLLNGTITLDAQHLSNVDFIFVLGSSGTAGSLTAAISSNVVFANNTGTNVGVYWVMPDGSASLLGPTFVGNILANTSITMGKGVTITCGSALAHTGDVTMINDTISTGCQGNLMITPGGTVVPGPGTTLPGPGSPPVPTPEPGTFAFLSSGLALGLLTLRKLR